MRSRPSGSRSPARIGITPLVDVVFILMIFFMLASRFTQDRQIDLTVVAPGAGAAGETRMVLAAPASLTFDGAVLGADALSARLLALNDVHLAVKPVEGATIQRVIEVVDIARAAGVVDIGLAQ